MADLMYPPNLADEEANPAFIHFQFFNRESIKNSVGTDTISLCMPQQVSQPSTVQWGSASLGFLGHAAASTIKAGIEGYKGGDGMVSALGGAITNVTSQGISQIPNGAELAAIRGAGNGISEMIRLGGGSATAEDLVGAAAGIAFNPYLTMLFRGVDFRTFSFNFKLVPLRASDCDEIAKIIETFRKYSLPDGRAALNGATEPTLKYPGECQIEYRWKNKRNPWLHKFARAVCTGINVDYTGEGMFSVMRTGMPSTIMLQTTWSEVNLVLRGDVEEGY